MPLDHYLTLGRSGLRVSPLCLGAMTFGEDLGWGSSVAESQRSIVRFVDALESIARAHDSTVARVALAWVEAQPGVTSTIIGARRLAQLEDNVQAIDVRLTAEELARLDALTKPTFGFPQSMQPVFP